jgi:hypothetical protein
VSATAAPAQRFVRVLLAIVVVAFGVRAAYVGLAKRGPCPVEIGGELVLTIRSACATGDELYYNSAANHLADGGGFTESPVARMAGAPPGPAADHPPLTIIVLAPISWASDWPPLSWVGDESHVAQHRWTMAVLGSVLVGLVGVLGRAIGTLLRVRRPDEVGWLAAGLAAVYPGLWIADGLIFSETVANVCLAGTLLVALSLLARPSPARALAVGVGTGLATLARAELALLWPFVAPLVAWAATAGARSGEARDPQPGARRWRRPAALVAWSALGAVTVVGPWVAYNLARFEEPVTVSTNVGLALAGSNCGPVYYGAGTGLTSLQPPCTIDPPPPGDQSEVSRTLQDRALEYMREHRDRVPFVMAARVGRSLSLFRPADMLAYNLGEGRERWATMAGMLAYYPLAGAAAAGLVVAARRRALAAWLLATPIVIVAIASAATYGQTRFRAPAEPVLVIAAAIALGLLVERRRTARSLRSVPGAPAGPR